MGHAKRSTGAREAGSLAGIGRGAVESLGQTVASLPPRPAQLVEPPELHPELLVALRREGVERLYSHQREAYELVRSGANVVVATATASGKSLCYKIPAFANALESAASRALFLYPTKALAQDQLGKIRAFGVRGVHPATYDGDTPQALRADVRRRANVVLTNPDMLNVGVLEVPADREPARERSYPDGQALNLLGYEHRRRLAGGVRVGGDHELAGSLLLDARQEFGYAEVFGLHAVEGREGAAEDVVETPVLVGALYRADVVGVLDDADRRPVAPGVAADLALLGLGEVEAAAARLDPLLHLPQGLGEPEGVLFLAPDNVEGDALGAPRPDGG